MARTRTTAQLRNSSGRASRKAAEAKTGRAVRAVAKQAKPDAIWRRYRLLIIHPEMDPAPITRTLGLKPTSTHRAGEPRFTPKDTALPGLWPDTRWSGGLDEFDGLEVEAAIKSFLEIVERHAGFWESLAASKGSAEMICSLDGGHYQGLSIDPNLLRSLADLNIGLGLEIYAVEQNS